MFLRKINPGCGENKEDTVTLTECLLFKKETLLKNRSSAKRHILKFSYMKL